MGRPLSMVARVAARRAVRLGLTEPQVKLEEQQGLKLPSNGNLLRGLHTHTCGSRVTGPDGDHDGWRLVACLTDSRVGFRHCGVRPSSIQAQLQAGNQSSAAGCNSAGCDGRGC